MSYRSLAAKPLNASLKTLLKRSGCIGVGLGAFAPVLALANPTGGQVIAGQATIANPSASGMVITQKSQSAIINWQQFNIGAGQYVQFLQPSSSSVVLNRVIGGSASSILGNLTGNGQVFLVNTNGVYFGKGSSIDTQGFLASTLGISDQNFLAHNYVFDEAGTPGATVVNQGNITAHHSGYVVLAGDYAENDGVIAAQSGHVILASGAKATLSLNGNSLINFAVNQSTLANYAGVKNAGSILADGGTVIMTADVANLLKSTVVNNTGLVEAQAISNTGGVIQLLATGGNIQNAGTLDASGTRAGQAGGQITLKGNERTALTSTSNIDATGEGARGGSVEVSGNTIAMRGAMKLGKGGKLLLDPENVELVGSGGTNDFGLGSGIASSGENLTGKIDVAIIEGRLDSGAAVSISAHHMIYASNNVHAITATGKGNLSFRVSQTGGDAGGLVKLGGVDINIGGKLTASMGYGSFGHLTAGSIDLNATGDLELLNATGSVHGGISKFSAKTTTGSLDINAARLRTHSGSGTAGIALDAKTNLGLSGDIGSIHSHFGNDVTLMGAVVSQVGTIITDAKFTTVASAGYADVQQVFAHQAAITATSGDIHFQKIQAETLTLTDKKGAVVGVGVAEASGDSGLTITAKNIEHSGSGGLALEAGEGDLAISGIFGANSAVGLGASLDLEADTISVNNRIKASQVSITANKTTAALIYTGTGKTFSISGSNGGVILDAAIGSAAAPVAYNVAISGKDGLIEIHRSIYTGNTAGKAAANISLSEIGLDGSSPVGVLIGDPNNQAVTLSAKGSITVTGANVGLGHAVSGSGGNFGQITVKAGKNVSMTAQGTLSHSGQLGIDPQSGVASPATGVVDKSILIQAGGNLTLTAHDVDVRAGDAAAVDNASQNGTVSYDAGVTLKARGNVTLQSSGGNGRVDLIGGSANAGANGANIFARTAVADAGVTISAGKAIAFTAHEIELSAGSGFAEAFANGSAHNTATADTSITLTAGTNVAMTATGGDITIKGAGPAHNPSASNGYAAAQFTKATATAHADVDVSAGGGITLTAKKVTVEAGTQVGILGSHAPSSANDIGLDGGAKAKFTATGNVGFTAGAGGILINANGGSASILGGNSAAVGAKVLANSGGSASMDVEAKVDFTTTGNLEIIGKEVRVVAGKGGASDAVLSGSHGGIAGLDVDQGVGLNAKGTLLLIASDALHIDASGGQANGAHVHEHLSHVNLTASGGITLTAGAVALTGSNSAQIDAGNGVGRLAQVTAESGGVAEVDAMSSISVTATTGNIALKSKQNVFVTAGVNLGDGYGVAPPTSSSIVFQDSGGTQFRARNSRHTDYTQVLASGSGAQASLTLGGAVNLSAKGGITLTQTAPASGSIKVTGGSNSLDDMNAHAAGGGSANVSAKSGVSLQAGGKLSLAGRHVSIKAGDNALHGASRSVTSSYSFVCPVSTACGGHFNQHFGSVDAKGDSASGHGSKVNVVANTSVAIKAGSVSISSLGSRMSLSGGEDGVHQAVITANGGAVTSVNLSDQVTITATGAVTLSALHEIVLEGGARSGGFSLTAQGGSANLATTTGVDITAATLKLTAGSSVDMSAGHDVGQRDFVSASHGTAKATQIAGINFTAKSAMGISLLGSGNEGAIDIKGGASTGRSAGVTGNSAGVATLDVSDDVTLTVTAAGGTLAVSGGKITNAQIGIEAGHSIGRASGGQRVFASHGAANEDLSGSVNLSALGTVTLNAGHGDLLVTGASQGLADSMHEVASFGGKATTQVTGDATITGGTISLTAAGVRLTGGGVSNSVVHAGNGEQENVKATGGGVANVDVSAVTSLKATGALGVTAGSDLSIVGARFDNGTDAVISAAGGKAQANYVLDQEVDLSGGTGVTLRGSDVFVDGNRRGRSGSGALIKALANGKASMDQTAAITITTGGTFAVAAADEASLNGAQDMGGRGKASANGGLAAAAYVADGTLKVSAHAIKLSAGSSLFLFGGRGAAASSGTGSPAGAQAQAKHGGSAAVSVDQSLDLTAVTAFSAKLTGLGATNVIHELEIFGGGYAGRDVMASASGAVSKATVTAMSEANVVVTGTTGTITLSTGNQPDASIYVGGDFSTAKDAKAAAKQHGTATVIADGDVSLSAKGAVTLTAAHGFTSVVGAFSKDGLGMQASASTGGKATVTDHEDVSITGGSVTLNAGGSLNVFGARQSIGNSMGAKAVKGGVANVNLDAQATLTALTGALTLTASSMKIVAASHEVGNSGAINASSGGAKAGVSLDAHTLLGGATGVSLVTTTGNMKVFGGNIGSRGGHNAITAKDGGHASLTEDMGISVVTGGTFTANAAGSLDVFGASDLGGHANVHAMSTGASADAVLTGMVSITAKSISISGGKKVDIRGGSSAAFSDQVSAFSGGIASMTDDVGVSLTATGGAISIKGVKGLSLNGGSHAAAGNPHTSIGSPQSNQFNFSGSNFSRSIDTLHRVVTTEVLAAGNGAVATLNADAGLSLTATGAISLTQTGGTGSEHVAGGSNVGRSDQVVGASRGDATLNAAAGVSIKAGGALTIKGHEVQVFGGDDAAMGAASSSDVITVQKCPAGSCSAGTQHTLFSAPVRTIGGNATAQLTADVSVSLQAASVTITAAASDFMSGGAFGAQGAKAQAQGSGDKAIVSVHNGLTVKAAGAITLAGSDIFIGAGPGNASSARVRASGGFASASLAVDKSVHFTAGGAFTATAGRVDIAALGSNSHLSLVQASGSGAKAKLDVTSSVGVTAQTLTLTATGPAPVGSAFTGSVHIAGGHNPTGKTVALDGGSAATNIDDSVNLNATGAVTLTALHGSVAVFGGEGDFGVGSLQSVQAYGGSAGTAKASLVAHNGVTINGSSLTLKAGTKVNIVGGSGVAAGLKASYGGSAVANLDASVKLNAGANVSLTATQGNISIGAAAVNGLLVDVDTSIVHNSSTAGSIGAGKPGGIVNGTLDAGVTLTAGQDVNLKAGGKVQVATGAGETLAVGTLRKRFITTASSVATGSFTKYYGDAWGGGSAHLDADLDATIVAGRDIKVSAGAGGIVVQGLAMSPLQQQGLENVVSVRGGSSAAVASINLTADASLMAGRDIVLNAKGNASVDGGSLAWVAADHTQGSVALAASAGATLHAGRNVVLNAITGNFTVGGIGVNASHQGRVSAVADTVSSGMATVTAHADAAVTAVGTISTVSSLGGALNVIAGKAIGAQALGTGSFMSTATATGNASITAGGSVTINAKGNLDVLGGSSDAARVSAARLGGAIRTAAVQATAGITAGGQLTLSVGGSADILARDNLHVAAIGKPSVGGVSLTATGDVSTSLQGAGITLTAIKGLLVQAGSASVIASASGSGNQATASATADVSLTTTGNLTLTVGKGTVGDASFVGGRGDNAVKTFIAGVGDQATVNDTGDMDISVGGNLSLGVAGALKIAGGDDAGAGARVIAGSSGTLARSGIAKDEISAKALVTVAGNLTVTMHGGDASLLGGLAPASHASVMAWGGSGSHAQARFDVDSDLTIKAGGTLKLTGAGNVTVATEILLNSSALPVVTTNDGQVSGKIESDVSIRGKSVNLNNGIHVSAPSIGSTSRSGLLLLGEVSIANTGGGSPIDSAPAPLSVRGVDANHALIGISPLSTGFGGVRSLSEWQSVPVSGMDLPQTQSLDDGAAQLTAPAVQPLGTLQAQGLTVSLETVVGMPAVASTTDATTLFTPSDIGSLQPALFLGSCNSLLLPQVTPSYRCTVDGR